MLYQNTVFKKLRTEDGLWTDRTLQALCRFLILQSDTTYNIFTTTDAVGRGFPAVIAEKIVTKLDPEKRDTAKILVFNDLSLIMYNKLLDAGYAQENIYLCYQDWEKPETNMVHKEIMNVYIESNFRDYETILRNYISLEEAIRLSEKTKFDYIIANPPYKLGNAVTRQVMESVAFDSYINLMPASTYRKKELFKNVISVESVGDCFEDALVGASLILCVLKNDKGPFQTYETFSNQLRDPRFVDFYVLNATYPCRYPYKINAVFTGSAEQTRAAAEAYLQEIKNEGDNTSFCITRRTVQNGTHVTANCYDYQWNILHNADLKQPITYDSSNNSGRTTVGFIRHLTPEAHRNLCRFWYNNSLMNDLIWGLRKSDGPISPAIPNVDFAKNRDWEHCTLEDLMKWLKEDNEPA